MTLRVNQISLQSVVYHYPTEFMELAGTQAELCIYLYKLDSPLASWLASGISKLES